MRLIYLFPLVISLQLHAFEDDDIDGVANSDDLCPDSSFEDIVDERGCVEDDSYWGKLSLSLGSDINIDDSTGVDYNFFASYNYREWDFSIYSSQQTSYDTNNNASSSEGDLYLSMGYSFDIKKLSTKLTLGSKIATGSDDISTGESDYFGNLTLNYLLNSQIALFSQLSYTQTGDSSDIEYRDPFGYSFGLGYMINSQWYSSLSYQVSESIYTQTDNYQAISLFNSYNFSKDFFATLNYTRGLDDLSYDHTISLKLGVNFE